MPNTHDVFSIGIDAMEERSFDCGSNEAGNETSNEGDSGILTSIAHRGEEATIGLGPSLLWPNQPLWQNKYCELLNDDFSFHERTMIQVCLSDEARNNDILGDTGVDVIFVLEHKTIQMTMMCWRLTHARLENGQLLSKIVSLYSEAIEL